MLEMTLQNAERWEKTRRLGRRRFVWLFGVLGGLLLAVGMTFFFRYGGVDLDAPRIFYPAGWILALIGGYIWGAGLWWWMEQRYAAARQQRPEAEASSAKTAAPAPGPDRLG